MTDTLQGLRQASLSPLDLLPQATLAEKLVGLVLDGPPPCAVPDIHSALQLLREQLEGGTTGQLQVVVLGGGTGLSSLVGGDSRLESWPDSPFSGLKEIFPFTHAVVCVTDDGGSTGELLKDLPLTALGDLRHVLLSSVQQKILQARYVQTPAEALRLVGILHRLFNHRFTEPPRSPDELLELTGVDLALLPEELAQEMRRLVERIFFDSRLCPVLARPHCLGNLLLASAIYAQIPPDLSHDDLVASPAVVNTATIRGIAALAGLIGAPRAGVFPCTTTPARLQLLYGNGVMVTGEHKSSCAQRQSPVNQVRVEFAREPFVPCEVLDLIRSADLIVLAPGSLYSSLIPVLQVPGLAAAVRGNTRALKLLVANIWVQRGETDLVHDAQRRRFYVSDLLAAYARNIPGGMKRLCTHVLALGLRDIPGSILQRYALERKEPIYCDREAVESMGMQVIEAGIFSSELLRQRQVIQHDPRMLARAVQTLAALLHPIPTSSTDGHHAATDATTDNACHVRQDQLLPCQRHHHLRLCLQTIGYRWQPAGAHTPEELPPVERLELVDSLSQILWLHQDIPLSHLANVRGLMLVDPDAWSRCQRWDQVFSFYDPQDGWLRVRADQRENPEHFATAVLVALGQSLLGNYALHKNMEDVRWQGSLVGRIFHLELRSPDLRNCLLSPSALDLFLRLARMRPVLHQSSRYLRLVNAAEGFTPPGLLFGLLYVWYLDNRQASHIEYKMSIMHMVGSRLIPEQNRTASRRRRLVTFFREEVFGHCSLDMQDASEPEEAE